MREPESVVVIGAGMSGHSAAATLRAEGFKGEVHLVGAEDRLPYDRPPVSKEILTGAWDAARIELKSPDWYEDQRIRLHTGVQATRVDVEGSSVHLAGGEVLRYDHVVLATGGRPRVPDIPGIDLEGVFFLRTLDDAEKILEATGHARSVAVVGSGFIGAEAAAAMHGRGFDVTMIEVASQPLDHALGSEVGEVIARIHREEGVELMLGAPVGAIHAHQRGGMRRKDVPQHDSDAPGTASAPAGRVGSVETASGTIVQADLVIVGVGIDPCVELASAAGCETGNGVAVDANARTTVPEIYAVGDIAEFPCRYAGKRVRVEHYNHAIAHGAVAARSILGLDPGPQPAPWFWSDQYDVGFQYAGHCETWDEIVWRGDPSTREFAAFYLVNGTMSAALTANMPREMRGVRKCIEAGVEVTKAQILDPDVDLRKLYKRARSPS